MVPRQFAHFRNGVTRVCLDRGAGFIERVQPANGAASPYLTEVRADGVWA
jgi:hypothetical protein